MKEYRIFAENGKYGLSYNEQIVLDSVYSSIKIINEDTALQDLVTADTWCEINDSWNSKSPEFEQDFALVSADGKEGLLFFGKISLEFKYERIIKLSYRHYLCKEGITHTLYETYSLCPSQFQARALAKIKMPDSLTLEKMLHVLVQTRPEVHEELSKYLYKASQSGTYISEYHAWQGMVHYHCIDVEVAIQRVIIDNDFRVTPLDLLVCH